MTPLAVLPVALALALLADPTTALAATGSDAGQGLGQMLQGWAQWLIPACAALVGVPALFRHDMGLVVVTLISVTVLGAFAWMTPDTLKTLSAPVLNALGGH